jgi:hypothetical protein
MVAVMFQPPSCHVAIIIVAFLNMVAVVFWASCPHWDGYIFGYSLPSDRPMREDVFIHGPEVWTNSYFILDSL